MANGISFAVPALLLGIVALTLLNVLYFFPWASVNHSATSDSIDRHERLITDIAEELGSLREVQEDLRSGLLSPFDRRVREALKGSRRDVQDFLNSPIFSEEAGKQSKPDTAPYGMQHFAESCFFPSLRHLPFMVQGRHQHPSQKQTKKVICCPAFHYSF